MPKRKNPRTPATIYQLRERLKKLNDSRRSPLSAATLWSTGMPPLSAATLWSITYAGLWHVAGRDPALAARWLKVLEKAVQVEGGGLLTGGGPWQRPALERDIDSFAKEDLAPGKPKAGTDWRPIVEDVAFVETLIGPLIQKAPPKATIDWWTARLQRLWRRWLGQSPLTGMDISNVVASRTPRTKAVYSSPALVTWTRIASRATSPRGKDEQPSIVLRSLKRALQRPYRRYSVSPGSRILVVDETRAMAPARRDR